MAPLPEGERDHIVPSRSGGVAHRWGLIHSAPRLPQVQPTVDTQWRTPRAAAGKAFQTLGRPARAWAAEAHQALARLAHDGQPTLLSDRTSSPPPPDGKRGRPGPGAPPAQSVSQSAGALASRRTDRQARVDQPSGVRRATHARDEGQGAAQAVLDGDKGPAQAARGVRFLQAPQFVASSCALKKPARLRAWLRVRTVGWLGDAALASRMRTVLQAPAATWPAQQGKRSQPPTARGVFQDFVGMHGLSRPGPGRTILKLTDEPQPLLPLLGKRSAWLYR